MEQLKTQFVSATRDRQNALKQLDELRNGTPQTLEGERCRIQWSLAEDLQQLHEQFSALLLTAWERVQIGVAAEKVPVQKLQFAHAMWCAMHAALHCEHHQLQLLLGETAEHLQDALRAEIAFASEQLDALKAQLQGLGATPTVAADAAIMQEQLRNAFLEQSKALAEQHEAHLHKLQEELSAAKNSTRNRLQQRLATKQRKLQQRADLDDATRKQALQALEEVNALDGGGRSVGSAGFLNILLVLPAGTRCGPQPRERPT
jgi:hypothetical protein